jgi:hypothetical protein
MAVNYDDLFGDVGEFVQRVNDFEGLYTDLDTDFSDIEADLDANGRQDILSGTYEIFEGFKSQVSGWIGRMIGKVSQRLVHRETILDELGLQGTDLPNVLIALYRDMVDNAKTILNSTVTVGAVTEDKTNADAGSLLVDKVLDGVNQPHSGFVANWEYNGVDSELAGTETLWVECVTDSVSGRLSDGAEQFRVFGEVTIPSPYSWKEFGSGVGMTFTALQGHSLLANLEMEDFSANLPASWTLDSGTAGTHVFEDTGTVKRGDSALKFTGDGVQAAIQISQEVSAGLLTPRKRYLCGFWVMGQVATTSGVLTIQFEGTGYAAASDEKIELDAVTLAAMTDWEFQHFYINWPTDPPADMALVIKWDGTPSAHNARIDGGGFAPVVYHNGVNVMVYAGSEKFLMTDRFRSAISNDEAGVFSTFFRKAYGFQLPSDAAPTHSDAYAT